MTEGEPEHADSDRYEELSDEQMEKLVDRVSRELESRDKERVSASLGMMTLEVESHEPLEETVDAFEQVWENRVEEIEDSMANTLREKLEDDRGGIVLG